jgi:hypothetical protein
MVSSEAACDDDEEHEDDGEKEEMGESDAEFIDDCD